MHSSTRVQSARGRVDVRMACFGRDVCTWITTNCFSERGTKCPEVKIALSELIAKLALAELV